MLLILKMEHCTVRFWQLKVIVIINIFTKKGITQVSPPFHATKCNILFLRQQRSVELFLYQIFAQTHNTLMNTS